MDNTADDERLIEDFLAGELTGEDLKQVEERLENDAAFREKYQLEKLMVEGIRHASQKDLLEKLKRLEERLPKVQEGSKPIPLYKRWSTYVAVAASIGLLLAAFLLWPREATNNEALYMTYYEPYPNFSPVNVRGENPAELSLEEQGLLAYEKPDYEVAAEKLTLAYRQNPKPETGFYLAQSLLALERTQESLQLLNRLAADEGDLEEMINWYRALAYVKLGKLRSAKTLLQKISAGDNFKHLEAQELLEQIR